MLGQAEDARGAIHRDGKDEEMLEEEGREGGRDGMHRERWQFIRVPGIVDTYYHAKYNMLTTSHNTAILSILPAYGRSANRVSPRAPRVENFIAEFGADAERRDASADDGVGDERKYSAAARRFLLAGLYVRRKGAEKEKRKKSDLSPASFRDRQFKLSFR